jgi:hypothetical protein
MTTIIPQHTNSHTAIERALGTGAAVSPAAGIAVRWDNSILSEGLAEWATQMTVH